MYKSDDSRLDDISGEIIRQSLIQHTLRIKGSSFMEDGHRKCGIILFSEGASNGRVRQWKKCERERVSHLQYLKYNSGTEHWLIIRLKFFFFFFCWC